MRRALIGIISAIVLVVLFIVLCTFVKRPYETILLERFGGLVDEQHQVRIMYNWFLKLPTDRVVPIDRRLHLYTGPLQQLTTSQKESISIRTFAAWRISDPVLFYKATNGGSDQRARDIIEQKLQSVVGGILPRHTLDELFNTDETKVQTAKIELQIAESATRGNDIAAGGATLPATLPGAMQEGLKAQGLDIVEVGFSRMAFPPANADAVYARMQSEFNKQSRTYDAEGRRQVAELSAQGEAEASKIRAEATARAEKIRGEGDALAMKIISDSLTADGAMEFYQYWKSLDFLRASLVKNTILVMSSDSELLRALFLAPTTRPGSPGVTTRPAPSLGAVPRN